MTIIVKVGRAIYSTRVDSKGSFDHGCLGLTGENNEKEETAVTSNRWMK